MFLAHWVKTWWRQHNPQVRGQRRPRLHRPQVEALEDRTVLSGTPVLVADIAPGAPGSYPKGLVGLNGNLYFVAGDSPNSSDLWKSDGTAAGTVKARQFSLDGAGAALDDLVNVCGTLYFSAADGVGGSYPGLWKSDGTTSGTKLVKELLYPELAIQAGDRLFFVASDAAHGYELWRSNGTASGTVLVRDIYSGSTYSGYPNSSQPQYLTEFQGGVYFSANDGLHGRELWKTDGTRAGTVLVKDIGPTTPYYTYGSNPQQFTAANGILFFTATTPDRGTELWKSDGTAAGTMLVKDIFDTDWQYDRGSHPVFLTEVNGTLFFTADDGVHGRELWKSDGTPEGTVLVKDIAPANDWRQSGPMMLTEANGTLYFWTDGSHGIAEQRLWKSDGTPEGTVVLETAGDRFGLIEHIFNVHGTLYFAATSLTGDAIDLWKTDGTPGGAVELGTIHTGNPSSHAFQFTAVGSKLYFIGNDGASPDGHGYELWSIDIEETPEANHDCGCGDDTAGPETTDELVNPLVIQQLTAGGLPADAPPSETLPPPASGVSSIPEATPPAPLLEPLGDGEESGGTGGEAPPAGLEQPTEPLPMPSEVGEGQAARAAPPDTPDIAALDAVFAAASLAPALQPTAAGTIGASPGALPDALPSDHHGANLLLVAWSMGVGAVISMPRPHSRDSRRR